MPRPHRQSARSEFGISSRPYESYFPKIPSQVETQDRILREHPYLIPYAVNNPYGEQDAADAGQAQAFIDQFDPSDEQQITGLQRLVGRGLIKPQQANSMFSMADRMERQRMAQARFDQRQQAATQRAMTPTTSQIKNIEGLGDQYEQLIGMSDAAKDEAKAKAAQKFYGARTIPLDLTPDSKDPYAGMTPEAWKKGYHSLHDKLESNYVTAIKTMLDAGKPVDERHLRNYQQIMDSRNGDQPTSSANAQSTEAPQQASGVIQIHSKEDWVKLPPGTRFIDSYGKPAVKR
jgi:hypothetical protein